MFNFLFRRIRTSFLHGRQGTKPCQSCELFNILQLQNDPSFFRLQSTGTVTLRFMSTTSKQPSFTVSYLVDKLGFSPESALKASNYLHLKTSTNAETVISFLAEHGFSQSQIKTANKKAPALLVSDVEKTILPKLKYLLSKGFSKPELAQCIAQNPTILRTSLERHIIPFFNTYSSLIHSDEKTIKAIRRYPRLISRNVDTLNANVVSNINFLRDLGVPESNVIKMLHQCPGVLLRNPDSFKEIVEKVQELGLEPQVLKFVHAVRVLATIKKSTRERKFDAYKKWGCSEKEIWESFRKHPFCFIISEDMIMAKMDFLVNKMGIDSSRVVNQPTVLGKSLKKRIVPRGLFAQHLLSKGLIKDFKLSALFDSSEENFLKFFVTRHVAEAPELLKLYKANLKM